MCACTLPEKRLLSTDSSLEKEHLKKKNQHSICMPLKSRIQHPIIFLLLREVLTAARHNGPDSETPKEPSRQPTQL